MSVFVPRRRRSPSFSSGTSIAITVVASAAVLLATMWAIGLLDLSQLRSSPPPSTAGLVAVPTVAVKVPPYTRLTRDHLWDVRNARPAVVFLPPAAVTPEMLLKLQDVIGRVVSHEKLPGYVFTEADFLPKGTREGLVAGIPTGKRAMRIAADAVEGLHGLHLGDRFDLVATMPIDDSRGGGQSFNFAGPHGQQLALEARLSNWQKQATVRVMVENGVIVQPISLRGVPTYQSSIVDGGASRTRPVQEAVIAVDPEEVARLTEAMVVGAKITAVPRSGRPDDRVDSRTPNLRPVSPFADPSLNGGVGNGQAPEGAAAPYRLVETIMGQKRELTAVPRQ